MMQKQLIDPPAQGLAIGQIADPEGTPADLVLVGRTDAAPGGSDLGAGQGRFAGLIQLPVEGKNERCVFGDHQIIRRHLDAEFAQLIDFVEQGPGIEHHAIADHRHFSTAHDTRGQQAQLVGDIVDNQRVPGIVAALEAGDDVRPFRQPIDDLAFSFIAPLGADYRYVGHSGFISVFAVNFLDALIGQNMRASGAPCLGRRATGPVQLHHRDPAIGA